jgi:uncharacterized membrane protein YesL
MAGFFGFFDYSKPGPGVSKDTPQKHGFFVFFEVLQRKFFNLVTVNLLFSLFNIPAFLILPIITQFYYQNQIKGLGGYELALRFAVGSILIFIPVITVGPAQAGLTYILRNYTQEKHAFLFSDFIDAAKSNFKQTSIIGLIDLGVTSLAGISMNFYISMGKTNSFYIVPQTLIFIAFIIFIIMHFYIYPLTITFKLTLKQIYKNSLIFAIAKLFPNLLILITIIVIAIGPYVIMFVNGIQPLLYMFLIPLITVSFTGLIINFYSNSVIQKFMLSNIENSNEKAEEPIFREYKHNDK